MPARHHCHLLVKPNRRRRPNGGDQLTVAAATTVEDNHVGLHALNVFKDL
jgi:hypothetical protein